MKAMPWVFDGDRRSSRSNLHPYFFQRGPADVLEEAFSELLQRRLRPERSKGDEDDEREVIREQRWTLFVYDGAMQRLFNGDFDAFCAALDDPKRMHERLQGQFRRLAREQGGRAVDAERPQEWDDRGAPVRHWEEAQSADTDAEAPCEECGEVHTRTEGGAASLDDDPIYDAAFRWACRTERWSRRLYAEQRVRDRDLFRVLINATLIPAKVAFGFSGGIDQDLAGLEVAAIGYRQAAIFLTRTLESLANCYGKRIGRPQTAHHLVDEGRELLADIESRLAEIESEIRRRGG